MTTQPDQITHDAHARDTWQAVRRGLSLRCPACGRGKVLSGFLRPAASCSSCGEDLTALRADDGPAWATILIIGHIVSPMFFVFATQDAQTSLIAFFVVAALVIGLAALLLPRMKGLFMALIWSTHAGEVVPKAD